MSVEQIEASIRARRRDKSARMDWQRRPGTEPRAYPPMSPG